ncbi:class I SAM-dependent methyltransferase [Nocardioides terrisoli]|uniref:class I SAM-dependent methyltransferase n=1 Tax=Nocardioides terrisoli TaxID=3388267 RepID=UPI00287B7A4D|nr:class I SAM-dependent methyltransferase [Nocardioides marmorisolisilvae]
MNAETPDHALSFGAVADAYDRARPSYPAEAARWLTGNGKLTVLELGAGTGKLTEVLVGAGHRVIATDPLPEMLTRLRARVVPFAIGVSGAEAIPSPSRSVDVVVCAQSFHWFDHARALPEIARVLRPGGVLALVWNQRDEGIPWVKRLGRIIGTEGQDEDLVKPIRDSALFGFIEEAKFRTWQRLDRDSLLDLVRSRSYVATLDDDARLAVLAKVLELYDDYGRGHDGMLLPYVTRCFRATVQHPPDPPPRPERSTEHAFEATGVEETEPPEPPEPPEDPGTLLIDFH